jgi:hypothetical protein
VKDGTNTIIVITPTAPGCFNMGTVFSTSLSVVTATAAGDIAVLYQ